MLVYLDQNYASRIAKFLRGQRDHAAFGEALRALREARPTVPPSPFHVRETRGGYLLPTLRALFDEFSGGLWVRDPRDVIARQAKRAGLDRGDLLTPHGDWHTPAEIEEVTPVLAEPLDGPFPRRVARALRSLEAAYGLASGEGSRTPSLRLFARLLAFRSLDAREPRESDAIDLVMAATVAPYVDVLGTDRYVAEMLARVRAGVAAHSGRRQDVLRFAGRLRGEAAP